jgi:hypothetical protein
VRNRANFGCETNPRRAWCPRPRCRVASLYWRAPVGWVLITLLRMALWDPIGSSMLGAVLTGEPGLGPELVSICRRESHCRPVRAHAIDAWAGPVMHRKAMAVDWLDASCPFHHGTPERFSTRGVHGLSAAYSLRFLPACLPPEVLDIPLVSAVTAARRAQHQCRRHGACNGMARRRHWAGTAKWDRREKRRREDG